MTLPISIHAPSRERPIMSGSVMRTFKFQSTLPHGSDWAFQQQNAHQFISIHAPSRERQDTQDVAGEHPAFQSTLPHGSDPYGFNVVGAVTFISIHAPSRERPHVLSLNSPRYINFNPRSLTGATRGILYLAPFIVTFQSTLPHGSDTDNAKAAIIDTNFNPRSLTGATASHNTHSFLHAFQSTLPHGSDFSPL